MAVETKSLENYKLKGNYVIEVPIVGNLVYDELGELVLAKFNERFKGVENIEDTHEYKRGEPISFSNVPKALGIDQILREETNGRIHVLSPYEVVQYWDAIPEKNKTYADTNSIVVYPNKGTNEDLRERVLDIIGKDPRKVEVPIIVSGLGIERANNDYGFTFTETEYIETKDAPFLERDRRVKYDNKQGLVSSEDGVFVGIPSSQLGLRRLYRDLDVGLDAGLDYLLDSNETSRVQIVQEPQARAENLEVRLKQLQEDRDRQIAEVNARYQKASKYLITGQF